MKSFFKNITLFFIYLYGSLLILMLFSSYKINKHADFKLEPNITKILIGNSHPACAFNDSLITNFKNLAKAGESYFYGYHKLKEVLKQNNQINQVFIELNPVSILIREDDKIWQDRFIKHQVPNNLAFFGLNEHKLLSLKNPMGYKQAALKGLKLNLKRVVLNQYNFIDSIQGYRYIKWNVINSILDTISYDPKIKFKLNQKKIAEYDQLYLKKSINLLKSKNIKVTFIRSPYHKMAIEHKYEDIFQNYRKEEFSDIEFLDFLDFPISDSEFGDLHHLNYIGARKFSNWFNTQINIDENSKL